MLRWQRARWLEGVAAVASAPPGAVDLTDAKARGGLLRWQNAGRDVAARYWAFAVPSARAVRLICRGGRAAGTGRDAALVELGAGQGYWATRCARALAARGAAVRALDTVPPGGDRTEGWRAPAGAAVEAGTARELEGAAHRTLLLCMPSPGEEGIATEALHSFGGRTVAYVGEWNSGMTGTRGLHAVLLREFTLVRKVELPRWPGTRVCLFLFRRRPSANAAAPPSAPPLACDGCGATASLRACPWTRHVCACSEECFRVIEPAHRAAIDIAFCGARGGAGETEADRPAWARWEACEWLEAGECSERSWLELAKVTPQPERECVYGQSE
jgi:hypothetical protein